MTNTTNNNRYPVAFEIWKNGGWQKSATHTSDSVYQNGETHFEAFCNQHASSGTMSQLIICHTAQEESEVMEKYFGE